MNRSLRGIFCCIIASASTMQIARGAASFVKVTVDQQMKNVKVTWQQGKTFMPKPSLNQQFNDDFARRYDRISSAIERIITTIEQKNLMELERLATSTKNEVLQLKSMTPILSQPIDAEIRIIGLFNFILDSLDGMRAYGASASLGVNPFYLVSTFSQAERRDHQQRIHVFASTSCFAGGFGGAIRLTPQQLQCPGLNLLSCHTLFVCEPKTN